MSLLSDDELAQALAGSPWQRDGDAIVREREFDDFAAAIRFVNQVAEAAEAANHHPDILVHGWNKVRLVLTTHDQGGVTQSDVDMAKTLDDVG
jgi:4a-hydroxytetrahydrobiopterin dehydratase